MESFAPRYASLGFLIDAVQSFGILIMAGVLIYIVVRLEGQIRVGVKALSEVSRQARNHSALSAAIEEARKERNEMLADLWKAVNEVRQREPVSVTAVDHVWQRVLEIEQRLKAQEDGKPPPPGSMPGPHDG